ncbi:MAG: YkgJ family cysteine cluster protein [Pyrinomonadaceae bacterium]
MAEVIENEEMLAGDLRLNIGGEHFELNMTIPAAAVKPRRMLPVFQSLTNTIVARAIDRSAADGKAISCKAACGACCRQPLLISEAEAFALADLIENMPAERRSVIKQRFRDGRQHFADLGWFDRFDEMSAEAAKGKSDELGRKFVALLSEYIAQGVACPFLENESCSIYEDRPLICREYLVTSPAENCVAPRPDNIEKLPLSGSPSRAFGALVRTDNVKTPSELLLIRILEFAETHSERFESRVGPAWADDFFRKLTGREEPGLAEDGPSDIAGVGPNSGGDAKGPANG